MWEMTRSNGTFLYERAYDPMTGKSRTLSVKINGTSAKAKKEAQKKLMEKLENYQPKKLHLSDLIKYYNEEHERTVRESTYKRDEHALKTMLGVVDDILIEKMTAGYIRRKLVESGKDNSTCNELIKRFKTFLGWAYRNDYIERDVMDKLQLFPDKSAREKVQDKFLEKEELQKLLDAIELERHRLMTEFLALSGLRIGEAIALNDEDVTDKYVIVSKTYNEALCSLGPAKTATSNREVFIQPELADCIRRIRTCMKRQRLQFGYKENGFFFSGIDGGRLGYAAYNKVLKAAAKTAVPNKQVTPHCLRHTMTSLFAEAGIDLETISRRLGHEDSAITKRVYMHVTEARKAKENEQIKKVNLLA